MMWSRRKRGLIFPFSGVYLEQTLVGQGVEHHFDFGRECALCPHLGKGFGRAAQEQRGVGKEALLFLREQFIAQSMAPRRVCWRGKNRGTEMSQPLVELGLDLGGRGAAQAGGGHLNR
ncbi:MAG: hypothetical protein IPL28_06015 [Chloroflexi bacterium]|nr:hypothetical protein [Chloroflexota bacterium]